MKQVVPLHINIPKPCAQDWEAMTKEGDGRHCSHCNHIVYDFSQMNDEELFNFFKQRPSTHCGRFHRTQLNREILPLPVRKKIVLSKFNRMVAAFFAVLSFKAVPSHAKSNNKPLTEYDANFKTNIKSHTDKIIISGTVKDAAGKPLENAVVMLDSIKIAVTDAEGKYQFVLDNISASSHNLYFSYGDLNTVVRNYHPAMLSTSYDIKLYKTENIGMNQALGGVIDLGIADLPSFVFKTNVFKLSSDHKALLATVAVKMKTMPVATVIVTAYPDGCERKGYVLLNRVNNIKKYLVEKEGIAADRITTNLEVGGGDRNVVDIKSN